MSFSEILGQKYATEILKNSLKKERISHAYLFYGPEGVGKELTALTFAQTLFCKRREDYTYCNLCEICRKIKSNNYPDLKTVQPEGMNVKIEQIREIQKDIFYKPIDGRRKIYIIKEAEKMNAESANCFLKILEEPPHYGIFILLTVHPYQLPETIISRCQLIRFEFVPQKDVLKILKDKLTLPEDKIKILSNLCFGQPGIAIEKGEELYKKRDKILELLLSLSPINLFYSLKIAEELRNLAKEEKIEERKKLIEILEIIIFLYRDLIILKEKGDIRLLINQDKIKELENFSKNYPKENILKIIELLRENKGYVKRNVNINLVLESICINIAKYS